MKFYPDQLFHIYNQGNDRQTIFFRKEHYQYFLWKMRAYLLPFGDLIAYCLMPTHFHWQFYVRRIEIERKKLWEHVDKTEFQRRKLKYGFKAQMVNANRVDKQDVISLNQAIGLLQKSYTSAINREMDRTGSLFRKECKAKDGWIDEFITSKKPNGKLDHRFLPGTDYAFTCFCYIHDNPQKAGLVANSIDWPYSSAADYAGLRKGSLCNVEFGKKLLGLLT